MTKYIKKLKFAAFIFTLTIAFSQIALGKTLYESKSNKTILNGVSYESSRRVTDNGLMDVHIMTVDLTKNYIEVKPIASQKEHGLKESTTAFMKSNGAIAGVNGDFFGLVGNHSAPFGLEIIDGQITAVSESSNFDGAQNASFLIDNLDIPFITYIKTELVFLNNGEENLKLYSYNRVTDAILPFCVDKNAYDTTAELDARFSGLYKIIVENEIITYVSGPGEVVTIPELADGYALVMNENTAMYNLGFFEVGQTATLQIKSDVDITAMQMAISGGGKILSAGSYVDNGFYITGRHPRTALGLSEDNTKLIMMVVDGRNGTIGATHGEMAELLLEYGAYNAMHLDGGGSSTMAISDETGVSVLNDLSEGSERKVINGLGVFNNSQMSEITSIEISAESETAFNGAAVKIEVYGLDEAYNKVKLDNESYSIIPIDGDGYYSNGFFYPTRTGELWITAIYNDLYAIKNVNSVNAAHITTSHDTIRLNVGESFDFKFTGRSSDGHSAPLMVSNGEVTPDNLASYDNGHLTALNDGVGFLKLTVGSAERYVKLIMGSRNVIINPFEPAINIPTSYASFPESNLGHVVYTSDIVESGTSSLELAYKMEASNETQAAYIVFDNPILLPDKPVSLKVSVYGDNSNNWLRGRITDANGESYTIDFARYIDWEGFKTVEARIPDGVSYPVALERIYAAALENTNTDIRKLYFNNLIATYPIETGDETTPASTSFSDGRLALLNDAPQEGEFDITLIGDITFNEAVKPDNYTERQNDAMTKFNENSSYGLFVGDTDNNNYLMPSFRRANVYDNYTLSGVKVITLIAGKGSLYSSYPQQWRRISGDLDGTGDTAIILIDKNPLTSLPKKEFELLHELLTKTAATGKTIFVVSPEGFDTTLNTRDGVRYINLGGLWKNGTPNQSFYTLRIRIGGDVRFSLQYR